jgi:diguanylate cyclase (GGDEF)-like protein
MEKSNNSENESFKELVEEIKRERGAVKNELARKSQLLQQVRELEQAQATASKKLDKAEMRSEELERLTLLDPLTNLYNHRTFIKELKAELSRARRYQYPVALCMISIDNFEELGEQYGHLTADAVLKIIGNAIHNSIREVDLCGRYDKHQFVIALSRTGISGGAIVAERIRQRIGAQAISYNWESFSLTASFGVAAFPEQANEWDELIAEAINAMEHATVRGGDRVLAV